jgi:hypothetical protein
MSGEKPCVVVERWRGRSMSIQRDTFGHVWINASPIEHYPRDAQAWAQQVLDDSGR